MGVCSNKIKEKSDPQTQILNIQTAFEDLTFYFSTESLNRIKSDVIVFFIDVQCSVKVNPLLRKVGKTQARLVQQFFQNKLSTKPISQGQCFIFKNPGVQNMDFEYFAFICVQLWNRKVHTKEYLEQIFINSFQKFKGYSMRSLCFTQIDSKYGYPANMTSKAFIKALHLKKAKFDDVTIVFNDINHRNIYMGTLKAFENEIVTTDNQNASIAQSIYF